MKRKPRLRPKASVVALAAFWALPAAALGQNANRPQYLPGEVIVYCQPGTPQATVNALAAQVNATKITPLLLPDCYDFSLPAAQQTTVDTVNAIATLKVAAGVRSVAPNLYFYPKQATPGLPTANPNDPYFTNGDQWALPLINMPQAWVLQKGVAGVNVCDIDSSFDPTHPDLIGQYLPDSYDYANNDTNLGPVGTVGDDQHGVFTSSLMVALTNNGIGMAGECWSTAQTGPKCLAFRTVAASGAGGLGTAIINAQMKAIADMAKDHIVAVNESFGGNYAGTGIAPGSPQDLFFAPEQAMSNAGLIVCVAAGNDAANDSTYGPASYVLPLHLTVSAVNRKGTLASYSNFGYIQVAAPGGEYTGPTDPVLGAGTSTELPSAGTGYVFAEGTSAAAPFVTGLATLLMSVPGVTAQQAVSVIEQSANHSITGQSTVPDTNYGYGLIDAYQAMLRVTYSAVILSPLGINPATGQSTTVDGSPAPPVETLRPTFSVQISRVPLSNVNITQIQPDGTTIQVVTNGVPNSTLITQGILSDGVNPPGPGNPGIVISGVSSGTTPLYTISFRYRFDQSTTTAQETIQVNAQPSDATVSAVVDTRTFTLAPHQLPAGTNLVSIPYYESALDSPSGTQRDIKTILSAPDAALYRWVTTSQSTSTSTSVTAGSYASSGTGSDAQPALATLYPTDITTTTDDGTDIRPIGLGYFLKTSEGTLVRTYGVPATSKVNQNVHIPIREGWNMIGDPYSFEVDFSSAQVQTPDGNRQTVSDAVTNNLILPFIYNYSGGDYQFDQLPSGALEPWQGHWIYVIAKDPTNLNPKYTLTLIVPPTGVYSVYQSKAVKATRSATISRVSGSGSWSLQLAVTGAGLKDTQNYIGESSNATDGQDKTKAPKAPLMSPYVSLGMSRANGALYAQDLRALGGAKTWNLAVSTDQKNTDLTVTWPNITQVPRTTRLMLTDVTTGQTMDMRTTHAFTFKSASSSMTRQFTVTATPGAASGRATITSLFVNPSPAGRGAGGAVYQITYALSRDASVDVTVIGPTGRTLGLAQPSRAVSQGDNTAVWNGHDSQGRAVPAGPYTLQVRAVTPDGDVTRRTVSVVVTGR